jgi:hypothetical protein
MSMDTLKLAREALRHAEQRCRYHRENFGFLGFEWWGEPRCESCRQPWRVTQALAAIDRELTTAEEVAAALISFRGEVGESGPEQPGATRSNP